MVHSLFSDKMTLNFITKLAYNNTPQMRFLLLFFLSYNHKLPAIFCKFFYDIKKEFLFTREKL